MQMTKTEKKAWHEYFSCVAGWTFHPGYYRENATKPTLEECADVADEMIIISRQRFKVEPKEKRPGLDGKFK